MRKSDEALYTEMMAARAHSLRRTAYLMCGDWHQAEDLTQTVFIKLYRVWGKVQKREALDGYLRVALIRACIDAKRRTHNRESPYGELPEPATTDEPAYEERDALISALAAVAPGQRAVLVLRYWEDLSVEETAGILGLAPGTVKSQAARGLAVLRGVLANSTTTDRARELTTDQKKRGI